LPNATRWVESLSPWPADGFGTERMRALLGELGYPQSRFPAIHVVGTNGKSTTTRLTETLLAAVGLKVGAYLSPHVRGWSERIRVAGEEADFETAVDAVRPAAEALGATQFEVLTAAALAAFAAAHVDVAVVEAGLGGRHDATNVLRTRVVVLTNVALDHMDVLGDTREEIAAEKLAVVQPGCVVVLGDPEWEELARDNGAARIELPGASNLALAVAAAEAFLGRDVDPHAADDVVLPGRLERRGDSPLEIWDGAHNLAGLGYLLPRLPARDDWVVVASILSDKRPELMLEALSVLGGRLVATQSSNERALPAGELAARAEPYFQHVDAAADPGTARRRALDLAGPGGAVVVTGSLYLLAELSDSSDRP
jgi:dihydrofolate synthase/folylpolyglutamate synthase